MKTIETHSAEETTDLGRRLSNDIKPGTIVLLRGDLGAGKTILVKGIAEGFHAALAEDVHSTTLTLIHVYRVPEVSLYHCFLYRIETTLDVEILQYDAR